MSGSGDERGIGHRLPPQVHIPPHLAPRFAPRHPSAPAMRVPGPTPIQRFWRWAALAMAIYGAAAFGAGMFFDRVVWPWEEPRWSLLAGFFMIFGSILVAGVLGKFGQGGTGGGYDRHHDRDRDEDERRRERERSRDSDRRHDEKSSAGDGGEKSSSWSSSGGAGGGDSGSSDSGSSSGSSSSSSSND